MHLMLMSTLYTMKAWDDSTLPEAKEILEKSEKETPWYTNRLYSSRALLHRRRQTVGQA